ncbi:MAG: tetratricopeptide repeat protein [Candidatus Sumerlaeaceae bacterium]|nr:tetratricopeptide repeat protein [Candidatus Sumerlaeaceae bacterium]
MQKVGKLFQQNDYLGARIEAKELVLKYPDSDQAIVARLMLAQLYDRDGQPDEALSELSHILARKTQKDPEGIQALGYSIDILKRAKRYEEAYRLIDKFQKQYADDHLTSLQLSVARADVLADEGQTTPARQLLMGFLQESTSPQERQHFRRLIGMTFQRERDTTGAAEFFESLYPSAPTNEDKRDIALRAAWYYAAAGNYEKAREWTERVTQEFAKAIGDELDGRKKVALAQVLGHLYAQVGNLAGALDVLQAIYEAPVTDQEILAAVINDVVITLLRMGKVNEAVDFVRKAGQRFPESPLAQQAVQMESMKAQGRLDTIDTSPLVLRFAADPIITLDKKVLSLDAETTPTGSAISASADKPTTVPSSSE